jgi:hypothetical protein
LQPTLDLLTEQERLVLSYAALLSPDSIPLAWLRALAVKDYPELGRDADPGCDDPWLSLVNQLMGLRLLQAIDFGEDGHTLRLLRMHRLTQATLQRNMRSDGKVHQRFAAWLAYVENELLEAFGPSLRKYLATGKREPFSVALFGIHADESCDLSFRAFQNICDAQITRMIFDLKKFGSQDELSAAFVSIGEASASGRIPVVFWKNFDSVAGAERFGWLRAFLAPMQDGIALYRGAKIEIGMAIFVFATSRCNDMTEWSSSAISQEGFREELKCEFVFAKGPDFASRIRGYASLIPVLEPQ